MGGRRRGRVCTVFTTASSVQAILAVSAFCSVFRFSLVFLTMTFARNAASFVACFFAAAAFFFSSNARSLALALACSTFLACAASSYDGVGPHCTLEFLELLIDKNIVSVIRTPNVSQLIQFEDLVNFWQFKNGVCLGARVREGSNGTLAHPSVGGSNRACAAKDVGWYKLKMAAINKTLDLTRGR